MCIKAHCQSTCQKYKKTKPIKKEIKLATWRAFSQESYIYHKTIIVL